MIDRKIELVPGMKIKFTGTRGDIAHFEILKICPYKESHNYMAHLKLKPSNIPLYLEKMCVDLKRLDRDGLIDDYSYEWEWIETIYDSYHLVSAPSIEFNRLSFL